MEKSFYFFEPVACHYVRYLGNLKSVRPIVSGRCHLNERHVKANSYKLLYIAGIHTYGLLWVLLHWVDSTLIGNLFKCFSSKIVLKYSTGIVKDRSVAECWFRESQWIWLLYVEFMVGAPVLQLSILNHLFVWNTQWWWRAVLDFTHLWLQCLIILISFTGWGQFTILTARWYTTDLNTFLMPFSPRFDVLIDARVFTVFFLVDSEVFLSTSWSCVWSGWFVG